MDYEYFNINYLNYSLSIGKLLQSLINILILLIVIILVNFAIFVMSKASKNSK